MANDEQKLKRLRDRYTALRKKQKNGNGLTDQEEIELAGIRAKIAQAEEDEDGTSHEETEASVFQQFGITEEDDQNRVRQMAAARVLAETCLAEKQQAGKKKAAAVIGWD